MKLKLFLMTFLVCLLGYAGIGQYPVPETDLVSSESPPDFHPGATVEAVNHLLSIQIVNDLNLQISYDADLMISNYRNSELFNADFINVLNFEELDFHTKFYCFLQITERATPSKPCYRKPRDGI